jgi:hypothetical protein
MKYRQGLPAEALTKAGFSYAAHAERQGSGVPLVDESLLRLSV